MTAIPRIAAFALLGTLWPACALADGSAGVIAYQGKVVADTGTDTWASRSPIQPARRTSPRRS